MTSPIGPIVSLDDHSFGHRFSVTNDDRFVYSATTDIAGEILSAALDTYDCMVREALIKMGWTPPKETT